MLFLGKDEWKGGGGWTTLKLSIKLFPFVLIHELWKNYATYTTNQAEQVMQNRYY